MPSANSPRERWIIERQVDPGSGRFYGNMAFTTGNVPGRVLDIIKNEILLHMPHLEDEEYDAVVDETVSNIVKRLARAEDFDFEASMEADKQWHRGPFTPKETA